MSHLAIGVLVLAGLMGGMVAGMFGRTALPEQHLNAESKEVIKLGMGLVATMAALLLGLMVASAKSEYDAQDTALKHSAGNVIRLDRVLAGYGRETTEIRDMVRRAVVHRLDLTWPEHRSSAVTLEIPGQGPRLDLIETGIRELSPKTDPQRLSQHRALQVTSDLLDARWLVLAQASEGAPPAFLVVVVCWLTLLFAGFGLFAPRNITVIVVLFVCAASVASSLFLILELGSPYDGMVKLSGAPLHYAVSQLGR